MEGCCRSDCSDCSRMQGSQGQGRVCSGNSDGGVVVGQQLFKSLEVFDILSR